MKKATFKGRVTQFLYLLMRDHLPTADVEDMVRNCEQSDVECTFSNGHLAEYAKELSDRLNDETDPICPRCANQLGVRYEDDTGKYVAGCEQCKLQVTDVSQSAAIHHFVERYLVFACGEK